MRNTSRCIIQTGVREEIVGYEGLANVAVDWLAQNLYYTDFVAGNLCVVSLRNFTNHKCLLDSLTGPRFVLTDPRKGHVYFFDDDKIKRINADGTKLSELLRKPISFLSLSLCKCVLVKTLDFSNHTHTVCSQGSRFDVGSFGQSVLLVANRFGQAQRNQDTQLGPRGLG